LKADGSYTTIHLLVGSELVVSKSLSEVEKTMLNAYFIRCHNSYIINVKKFKKYNVKLKVLIVSDIRLNTEYKKPHQIDHLAPHF